MKLRWWAVGALGLCVAGAAAAAPRGRRGARLRALDDDRVSLPRMPRAMKSASSGDRVTVWLNGGGGHYLPGWEDSASGTSSVVYGRADQLDVPAWQGGSRRWQQLVQCVRGKYAAFNLDIVESRPRSGDYIEAVVGGRSSSLGFGRSVGGVAPYTGDLVPRGVVFVFATTIGENGNGVESVCTTATHEIGHALGLDHVMHCPDPMTYLQGCGEKRFADVDVQCGEGDVRTCGSGEETQNSWRHLMRVVGPASGGSGRGTETETETGTSTGTETEAEPEPETETEYETETEAVPVDDGEVDDLELLSPSFGDRFAAGSVLRVAVRAADRSGIARVELGWAMADGKTHVFQCDDLPAGQPVRCRQRGNLTVFELEVGAGRRGLAVRVTDGAGNQRISNGVLISFEE